MKEQPVFIGIIFDKTGTVVFEKKNENSANSAKIFQGVAKKQDKQQIPYVFTLNFFSNRT